MIDQHKNRINPFSVQLNPEVVSPIKFKVIHVNRVSTYSDLIEEREHKSMFKDSFSRELPKSVHVQKVVKYLKRNSKRKKGSDVKLEAGTHDNNHFLRTKRLKTEENNVQFALVNPSKRCVTSVEGSQRIHSPISHSNYLEQLSPLQIQFSRKVAPSRARTNFGENGKVFRDFKEKIRIRRKNRKVEHSQQTKTQKIREYQNAKWSRNDMFPRFVDYSSKKVDLNNKMLRRNMNRSVFTDYKRQSHFEYPIM